MKRFVEWITVKFWDIVVSVCTETTKDVSHETIESKPEKTEENIDLTVRSELVKVWIVNGKTFLSKNEMNRYIKGIKNEWW
jgi:hypothetical protein